MAKKTNKYWDERALRRLSDAEKIGDEYIKRVKSIYNKAFKDIDKEIASVYRNYSKDTGLDIQKLKELLTKKETDKVWKTLKRQGLDKYIKDNYKARISRLEQIQAQIYAKAKLIYPKEELEHTMAYKGVINDSYYKTVYDTQMGTGYDFSFSKIDKNMEKALLTERWSGKNYSERIWGNTDILAENVSEIVGSGLLEGRSLAKMSKELKERFKVNKYYAERLIRTEVNHFNNEADAMAYEEMGVDMYVFVATLDNRTSEICQTMDGKKFPYKDKEEGVNFPPLHPNCRSKTRGYLGEEYETTLKRRARNPITGKTEFIDNMSYSEWLKKQKVKYGDKAVTTSIKQTKNKTRDKTQYEKYKPYLGKDVKDFETFQKIKYNDTDKWENVKEYVSISRHGEMPNNLSFNKYYDNIKDVNWEAVDFSPLRVDKHYEKHANEFSDIDKETYINNAKKLLNSNINDTILGFANDKGFRFKYDSKNNEFATCKPSGVIETYFKPKNGKEYWEEQVKEYGNKKDV